MKNSTLPGIFLIFLIAIASQWLSETVTMGGKHPIEASALAVIAGMLIRNLGLMPDSWAKGVATSEKFLVLGIVLLGAGLQAELIVSQGAAVLGIIIGTMAISYLLIFVLGRLFSLSTPLSVLLAAGTTICGTSAIAVTAPLIRAKESETSYAVAVVALFGLAAIFIYPILGHMAGASDLAFGVFAGTAIHSTPQVVGAAFIFSDASGQTATAVKLIRNCFLAPLALVLAYVYAKRGDEQRSAGEMGLTRAFPWFLFGYFIMAGVSSLGYLSKGSIDELTSVGKFLILVGMAGIGLSTVVSAFRELGLKPLTVGLLGSVAIAVISATMITALL